MKRRKTPDLQQAGNAMVEEFARLALELSVLDPAQLFALGEELKAQAELSQRPGDCSQVPNKIC